MTVLQYQGVGSFTSIVCGGFGEQPLDEPRHRLFQHTNRMIQQDALGNRDTMNGITPPNDELMMSAAVVIVHLRIGQLSAQILENQSCFEVRVYAHAVRKLPPGKM